MDFITDKQDVDLSTIQDKDQYCRISISQSRVASLELVPNFTSIIYLRLYNCQLTELPNMNGMQIQQLWLKNNKLTDIARVGLLSGLQILDVRDNQLPIHNLLYISLLQQLQQLHLNMNTMNTHLRFYFRLASALPPTVDWITCQDANNQVDDIRNNDKDLYPESELTRAQLALQTVGASDDVIQKLTLLVEKPVPIVQEEQKVQVVEQ